MAQIQSLAGELPDAMDAAIRKEKRKEGRGKEGSKERRDGGKRERKKKK